MYEVRPSDSVDEPMVRDAWMRSAKGGFAFRGMPNAIFEAEFKPMMASALERSVVLVVADKSRPERMLGFSVSEHPDEETAIVHYVYAKHDWRKQGVGHALSRAMGLSDTKRVIYTHDNTTASHIGPKLGWQYNPFLFWRPNLATL